MHVFGKSSFNPHEGGGGAFGEGCVGENKECARLIIIFRRLLRTLKSKTELYGGQCNMVLGFGLSELKRGEVDFEAV